MIESQPTSSASSDAREDARFARVLAAALAEQVHGVRDDDLERAIEECTPGVTRPAGEAQDVTTRGVAGASRAGRTSTTGAPQTDHPDFLPTPAVLDDTARLLLRQIDRAARH